MPLHWFNRNDTSSQVQQQHRLGFRIVFVVLASTLLFASLISAVLIYRAYQATVTDAKAQTLVIEKNYLPLLGAALWSVDEPRIDALLNSIAHMPHIGRVTLEDDIGTIWERNSPTQNTTLARTKFPIYYDDNGETFLLGVLHAETVNTHIIANLQSTAQRIALSTLGTLLICAVFILLIIHFRISRHLEKMARYAKALDLTTLDTPLVLDRARNHKPDELDLVSEAINHMRIRIRDDVEKRNKLLQELTRHREQLELLVDERTKDLRQQTHLLDTYAHTVAHDLKQPLTNMVASTTLLNAENLPLPDDKKKTLLGGMQRSAQKMQAIIESLLLLASVRQADKIQRKPLDIGQIAHEACNRCNLWQTNTTPTSNSKKAGQPHSVMNNG
ncbi:histidine kinase dimerization/phospho-acceptor domain-containing protein [Cellvibrio sp. UBA7661]|uniref:histidine kinase dimerization/phospho-acceptor domain-containing protein n=1 Tax=Cellvibrio sp. UBA7661 TaxID=1946311 RepID=UPI002F35BEE1